MSVRHNEPKTRFEFEVGGLTAFASYRREGEKLILSHTEVPAEFREQGIGAALVRAVLDYARANQLRVVPLCPFAARFIKEHPEYQDLTADDV